MTYIDLHVHSNVSDGTYTPAHLVDEAYRQGLSAFALTDHDTIGGIKEAKHRAEELKQNGKVISVIPGVELSVEYPKRDIHILGLMIDIDNETFCKALEAAQQEREERNLRMVNNLAEAGIDISMEKLRAGEGNAILTRAHFAKYLLEHGYVTSTQEAFRKYLGEDGPYYVPRKYISPKKAIQLILEADGIPVLAHPLLYKLPKDELETFIAQLKSYGLVGIETIYSSNMGFDEGYVRGLANRFGLLMTGGSDFHGKNKPLISLGSGRGNLKVPKSIFDHLVNFKKNELKHHKAKYLFR